MSSKNNPELRGRQTVAREYNGKKVEPVLYINHNSRFMAAKYEDNGNLVEDANGNPIPYQSI